MGFFKNLFRKRIRYAHPDTKLRIEDYHLPSCIWRYYYLCNPFTLKSPFERDVDKMLSCKLDRFNVDFMTGKLTALYNMAAADIDEQYIYRKKQSLAIKTNRKVYIQHIDSRLEELERQNAFLEAILKEDGIEI